ncbi:TRAP transporter small permease [Martelella mediterranea]|uniref:TRAP transporter small permease protein n=1 Tax=Martelella mediterranea TaxID=293089 RepID=A0A4R3NTK2_9HYPH|nr:TRAP transporter small permease subunit [Martelella mediterranea]TCT39065.1 TRAP-type C4-dicarboxylate transport system permease small subunit [Martelella mediterranea]
MTSPLTPLYRLAEILAALSMISILLLVGGGIVLRFFGTQFAGSDDLAGYCLVAIFFLALAPTYRRSEHIRVSLLLARLPETLKSKFETVLTLVSMIAVGWATWWLGRLVYDSHRFGDVAQGLLPVPLWIPQLTMVIGMAIFFVALVEDAVRCLSGKAPSYIIAEATSGDDKHFER